MQDPTGNFQAPYPTPTERGSKTHPIVVALIVVGVLVFLLCMAGIIAAALSTSDDKAAPRSVTGQPFKPVTPTKTPDPVVTKPAYTASDFKLAVKVTDKDCIDFETMPDMCYVSYSVKLTVPNDFMERDDSYSITYELKGIKGGAKVGTIEVSGDGTYVDWGGSGETGAKPKLTVRITDVERRP